MRARFQYRAPFGLDIRVKPRLRRAERRCEWPNCALEGVAKAPKSRDALHDYHYFCMDHAREYNRGWNFFDGMDEDEFRAFQERERAGERPTWSFARNGRGAKTARATSGRRGFGDHVDDPFGFFGRDASAARGARPDRTHALGGMQRRALEIFDLDEDADAAAIKKRYTELLKRFHPDANGGDRANERRLQKVIEAYRALKRAGMC